MIYEVGDRARLFATFTDIDGVLTDPTAITLTIQLPDGSQTSKTYLAGDIIRDSVGKFHYDLDVTQPGPNSTDPAYLYRWAATGAVIAVEEGFIVVQPTTLVPQPPSPTPEFTRAALLAVDAAIAAGALRVRFTDREITYNSMDDLIRARTLIVNFLNAQNGIQTRRQIRVFTEKGW